MPSTLIARDRHARIMMFAWLFLLGLACPASAAFAAQAGGGGPRSGSTNYVCTTGKAGTCVCSGTADCRDMRGSGMCSGAMVCSDGKCTCTFAREAGGKPKSPDTGGRPAGSSSQTAR